MHSISTPAGPVNKLSICFDLIGGARALTASRADGGSLISYCHAPKREGKLLIKLIQSTPSTGVCDIRNSSQQFLVIDRSGEVLLPEVEPELCPKDGDTGVSSEPILENQQIGYLVGQYCGVGEKTQRLKFLIEGKKMMGTGALYAIGGAVGTLQSAATLPVLKHKMEGFEYEPARDVRIHCMRTKTDEQYVFYGYLEEYKPQDASSPSIDGLPDGSLAKPVQAGEPPAGKNTRKPRGAPKRTFADELDRISGLRDAGLDPDVGMDVIPDYVGESRATIYRKQKNGQFPPFQKRGRSVFLRLSVVEVYRLGQWVGEIDLDPAAGNISRILTPTPSNTSKLANDGAHGEKTDSAASLTVAGTDSGI